MKAVLGLIVTASLIAPAQAAWHGVAPVVEGMAATRIADGCGPGYFRGENGRCRPVREERWREERREERLREERREELWRERRGGVCPPGYYFVPRDGRCWPR